MNLIYLGSRHPSHASENLGGLRGLALFLPQTLQVSTLKKEAFSSCPQTAVSALLRFKPIDRQDLWICDRSGMITQKMTDSQPLPSP